MLTKEIRNEAAALTGFGGADATVWISRARRVLALVAAAEVDDPPAAWTTLRMTIREAADLLDGRGPSITWERMARKLMADVARYEASLDPLAALVPGDINNVRSERDTLGGAVCAALGLPEGATVPEMVEALTALEIGRAAVGRAQEGADNLDAVAVRARAAYLQHAEREWHEIDEGSREAWRRAARAAREGIPPPTAALPEEVRAAAEEALRLAEGATAPPWEQTYAYNNAGMPTADFKIPAHNGGATVEMLADDAAFICGARTLLPLLARAVLSGRAAEPTRPALTEKAARDWRPTVGARVVTADPLTADYPTGYDRRGGAFGALTDEHEEGGWWVRHDDGTEAPYDARELRPAPDCAACFDRVRE